jgi:hypothetical protein
MLLKKPESPMNSIKQLPLIILALAGGLILSFIGLGVLWAGASWPYQFGMFIPFLVLAFILARRSLTAAFSVLAGAAPIAIILVQFRDNDDSHLMPILVVACWVVGTLLGHYLGRRYKAKPKAS